MSNAPDLVPYQILSGHGPIYEQVPLESGPNFGYRLQTKFGPDRGTIKIWSGPKWDLETGP